MGPGLYVHVPFCVRKCAYCAFFSQATDETMVAAWLKGVERELAGLPEKFRPATVFCGGGTPTALGLEDLGRLLTILRQRVDLSCVKEWTCEVNPGTLTSEKADGLRAGGVTRLSIGAQSFDDEILRCLGRIHAADDTRACVELARAAGVEHIGLDLIYGVPGVPREGFRRDLEAVLELKPEHVSAYCLEIEADTPLARAVAEGSLLPAPDKDQREQYDELRQRLAEAGLAHYEISNFAKPGCECRHNLLYWSGGEYLGIGPAAHSHWAGARWGNTAELPRWGRAFEERLEPEAKARETLVMGLRRRTGWDRAEFRAATGFDYDELCGEAIARLAAEGRLVVEPDRIRLAEDALFTSDAVFSELV